VDEKWDPQRLKYIETAAYSTNRRDTVFCMGRRPCGIPFHGGQNALLMPDTYDFRQSVIAEI
jgi:hypothetical protein